MHTFQSLSQLVSAANDQSFACRSVSRIAPPLTLINSFNLFDSSYFKERSNFTAVNISESASFVHFSFPRNAGSPRNMCIHKLYTGVTYFSDSYPDNYKTTAARFVPDICNRYGGVKNASLPQANRSAPFTNTKQELVAQPAVINGKDEDAYAEIIGAINHAVPPRGYCQTTQ